jgi:hypothetical protein
VWGYLRNSLAFGLGVIFWALALMTQVPSDRATNILQGWFRDGGLPAIADGLGSPAVDHIIRHYAVRVLFFIGAICFTGPFLLAIAKRVFSRNNNSSICPDVRINDAIDYIVNDSRAKLKQPKSPWVEQFGPAKGHRMIEKGSEHQDALVKVREQAIAGRLQIWGKIEVLAGRFDDAIRAIPKEYWERASLDPFSCFHESQQSQSGSIGNSDKNGQRYGFLMLSREQLHHLWSQKPLRERVWRWLRRSARITYWTPPPKIGNNK